jgi:hypothetical protein
LHASKNQPKTSAIGRSLVPSTVLLPVPQPLVCVPQSPRLSSHKRVTFSSVVHSQSMPSALHRSFDAGSSLPQDINSQGFSASLAPSNRLEPLTATSVNLSLLQNETRASATDCNLVPSKAGSNDGKPLKALASFLDGVLETARIATQIEHSVTPTMVMNAPRCTKNRPERFHAVPKHDTQCKTLPTASVAHETPRHSPNVSPKVTRPLPLRKLSVQSRLVFRSFKSMRPPDLHKSLKPRGSNSQGPLYSNSLAGLSIATVGSPPLPPPQPALDSISGQRTCSARHLQNLARSNTVPSSHSGADILAALQSFSPFQVVLSSSPPPLVSVPRSANSDDIDCAIDGDYDEEEPSPLSSFASPIPSFAGLVSP